MSAVDFAYLDRLQGASSPGLDQLQMMCIYVAAVGAAIVLAAIVLAFAIGLAGWVWIAVFCFVVGFGALMALGGVRGKRRVDREIARRRTHE